MNPGRARAFTLLWREWVVFRWGWADRLYRLGFWVDPIKEPQVNPEGTAPHV